jgi:hypothetical protein
MEEAVASSMSWLTADMLTPLVENLTTAIGVVAPVGVSLMALYYGVSIVRRLIGQFM